MDPAPAQPAQTLRHQWHLPIKDRHEETQEAMQPNSEARGKVTRVGRPG